MSTPPTTISPTTISPAVVDRPRFDRRKFLRRLVKGSVFAGVGSLGYAYGIEPHWVEVVQVRLPLFDLPESLAGRRLVQISDLHVGEAVSQSYITEAVASIAEFRPDLIVITGDLMTCKADEQIDATLEVLRALPKARLGRFAAMGNHDYGHSWKQTHSVDRLCREMAKIDLRPLRNEVATVAGELQIAGLDDLWAGNCDVRRTLDQLDREMPTITMCHNPDAVDRRDWRGYRGWILAGHTHGGQCRAPWYGPPILPVRNRNYTAGEYRLTPHRRMYINRGLGYTHRVRFNCRPEITVFTLERESVA